MFLILLLAQTKQIARKFKCKSNHTERLDTLSIKTVGRLEKHICQYMQKEESGGICLLKDK